LLDGFNEDGVVVTSIIQSNGYVVVAGTFEYAGTGIFFFLRSSSSLVLNCAW